jgi:hypothetical protein
LFGAEKTGCPSVSFSGIQHTLRSYRTL